MEEVTDRQEEGTATLDVDSGAEAIFGLLSDDLEVQDVDTGGGEEAEEEEAADDVGEEAEEDFADEADDDADAELEYEEDEAETDDLDAEYEEADEDPLPQTVTVKVDGEELEVPLDEAIRGYQRQEAFTRKTQEVAEKRRAIEAQANELVSKQQQYLDRLEVVEKALAGEEPDPSLADKNPSEYGRQIKAYNERQKQVQAVVAERERVQGEIQERFEAEKARVLAEQADLLESKLPEWTDPETATTEKQRLAQTAQTTYGFSPEEVGNLVDHRLVLMLRDAMLYREMLEKGEKAKGEVKGKRRKSATLQPGNSKGKKKSRRSKKNSAARKRLAKTGRIDDAAASLKSILEI